MMAMRKLLSEDAQIFWELRLRSLQECPEAFGAAYEEEKDKPPEAAKEMLQRYEQLPDSEFVLGCFDDDKKLLGIVGLHRESRLKLRHKANLVMMYVSPEARGNGIGKALVNEAVRLARGIEGMEQINLGVAAHNEAAKRLYQSCGFTVFGLEQRALKVGDKYVDEQWMVLKFY